MVIIYWTIPFRYIVKFTFLKMILSYLKAESTKMKIVLKLLFVFTSNFIFGQDILGTKFETLKGECIKYNEVVSAQYYKESPIVLSVVRTSEQNDYTKTFMFYEDICICETYFYPKNLLKTRFDYLTALYGEAFLNKETYSWTKGDLQVTLTLTYYQPLKKEIVFVNYCNISEVNNVLDIIKKQQSPFINTIKLK